MVPLQVTGRRLWKNVYDELGGSPGSTSAATCTRRHYERCGWDSAGRLGPSLPGVWVQDHMQLCTQIGWDEWQGAG